MEHSVLINMKGIQYGKKNHPKLCCKLGVMFTLQKKVKSDSPSVSFQAFNNRF
jgi:hypothetical protein